MLHAASQRFDTAAFGRQKEKCVPDEESLRQEKTFLSRRTFSTKPVPRAALSHSRTAALRHRLQRGMDD